MLYVKPRIWLGKRPGAGVLRAEVVGLAHVFKASRVVVEADGREGMPRRQHVVARLSTFR